MVQRVTAYDEEAGKYKATARTGLIRGWDGMNQKEKIKKLLAAEGILMETGLEATAEWEEDEECEPLAGEGWWVKITGVDRRARTLSCRILGGGEANQVITYEEMDEAMEALQANPGDRGVVVEES